MIITCENCSTSFNLDATLLKPSGSKVRCSKCKHIFTAFPAALPEEKEAPPEEVPEDEVESAAEETAAPDMAPAAGAAAAEEDVQEKAVVEEGIRLFEEAFLPGIMDTRGHAARCAVCREALSKFGEMFTLEEAFEYLIQLIYGKFITIAFANLFEELLSFVKLSNTLLYKTAF